MEEPLHELPYEVFQASSAKIEKHRVGMRPLDKINVAAKLNLKALSTISLVQEHGWAHLCVASLLNAKSFLSMIKLDPLGDSCGDQSHEQWMPHLQELREADVLDHVRIPHKVPRVFLRYFEVEKTKSLSRSIVDGTPLNQLCEKPHPINLPSIEEIIYALSWFPSGIVVTGDIRHWFHHIPLPDGIRNIFSIKCAKQVFELKVLPMGFSWAPYIAQCLGWIIVLNALPIGYTYVLVREQINVPPSYIWIARKRDQQRCGVVFLWVDNILTISNNRCVAEEIYNKLRRAAKSAPLGFSINWKFLTSPTTTGSFLGFDFRWCEQSLLWKHSLENIKKWSLLQPLTCQTVQEVQHIIGVIMWDTLVRNAPFASVYDIHTLGRAVFNKQTRDKHGLSKDQLVLLLNAFIQVLQNCENSRVCPKAINDYVIAFSDASLSHLGYCICSREGRILVEKTIPARECADIYKLEFQAASLALTSAWTLAEHVLLGCDNTDTVHALMRRTSSREDICQQLLVLEDACTSSQLTKQVFYIPSQCNPADGLTRSEHGFCVKMDILSSAIEYAKRHLPMG